MHTSLCSSLLRAVISSALTDLKYPESVCTSLPLVEAVSRLFYVGSKYASVSVYFRSLFLRALSAVNQVSDRFNLAGFPSFLANDYSILPDFLRPTNQISFPSCLYEWFNLKPFVALSLNNPSIISDCTLRFVNLSNINDLTVQSESDFIVKSVFPNVENLCFTFSSHTSTLDLTGLNQLKSVTICNVDSFSNKIIGLDQLINLDRVSFNFWNGNGRYAIFPAFPCNLKHVAFTDMDHDVGRIFSKSVSNLLLNRLESATFSHFTTEVADLILPQCLNLQRLHFYWGWFKEITILNLKKLTDIRFEVCHYLSVLNFINVPRLTNISVDCCFDLKRINNLNNLNLLELSVPCCTSLESDSFTFLEKLLSIELNIDLFSQLPNFSSNNLRSLMLYKKAGKTVDSHQLYSRFPFLKHLEIVSNS
ncbi:hypothetical protein RCL1_001489 [Eukaryota sp. TZLM3-RCL]